MSKSIIAALIGVLVGQEKLSLAATGLLPEWRGNGDARARISLDELLRMTSGLQFNEDYADPLSDVAVMLFDKADQSAFAARKPLAAPPGARWEYSSGTTQILAKVIRQALGGRELDYLEFPRRALFEPLGMHTAVFEPDASGTLVGASFMCARANDWARFGQMLLQDGTWDGKRILPAGWFAICERSPRSRRAEITALTFGSGCRSPSIVIRRHHQCCRPTHFIWSATRASL
jgi:CubicO group peptidase (beta-lactamase class C family)